MAFIGHDPNLSATGEPTVLLWNLEFIDNNKITYNPFSHLCSIPHFRISRMNLRKEFFQKREVRDRFWTDFNKVIQSTKCGRSIFALQNQYIQYLKMTGDFPSLFFSG